MLAIIISGRRGENYKEFSQKLDKKYLISIFKEINIDVDKIILNINRNKIISKIKTPIFGIELKISDLPKNFNNQIVVKKSLEHFIKYEPISEFPTSFRDLSFSIKDSAMIKDLINTILAIKSDVLKKSFMFDFYKNKELNESKIGFRFIFQSSSSTLTDIEIDKKIKDITRTALSIKSVSLPGS